MRRGRHGQLLRGKDSKLFKLSKLYRTSRKTAKHQEPIKIIKELGPRVKSPSHGWETSEPAIRAERI